MPPKNKRRQDDGIHLDFGLPINPKNVYQKNHMRNCFILPFVLFTGIGMLRVEAQTNASTTACKIQVACVGASITAGYGTTNHAKQSYPAQMQLLLGSNYEVHNFGVSGATMLKHGNKPYWNSKAYQQALALRPDVVVIDLGGNDSKATNWVHKADFAADTRAMIESFQTLPSRPCILLCLPMPCFNPPSAGINDNIIKEQIPIMRQVASDTGVEALDMHTDFLDKKDWFADGIHPNADGAVLMAKIVGHAITNSTEQNR
jgi:lysophospholipase L1-like esterase